jgi:hypothetical protein
LFCRVAGLSHLGSMQAYSKGSISAAYPTVCSIIACNASEDVHALQPCWRPKCLLVRNSRRFHGQCIDTVLTFVECCQECRQRLGLILAQMPAAGSFLEFWGVDVSVTCSVQNCNIHVNMLGRSCPLQSGWRLFRAFESTYEAK